MAYTVGYLIGSLSSRSINRILGNCLMNVAPGDLEFTELRIDNLPLYNRDLDDNFPPEATTLKDAIARVDAALFITPEYNRAMPAALKNALEWASRPYGQNAFDHMPAAVIGASAGAIGTAVAQQGLRSGLAYCNMRQMTAPEAYIAFDPEVYREDGEVTDGSAKQFLTTYMQEFRDHVDRVLTVLPRR